MKPVEEMNKDELEVYAKEQFGVSIDKRRRLPDLVDQVKRYSKVKAKPAEVEPEPKRERLPKKVRHIKTGVVWSWNPLYKGNQDLEIIEWE
jgi:hypothetical protein